jgi:hypothetical protein
MDEAQKKMLLDWMRKVHQLEYAHRYQSIYWVNFHRIIGYSAFGLSTIIAFSFRFPSVESDVFQTLPFIFQQDFFVAFASTAVALLTGLQTFLKPNEKAEQHKNTGSNYEKIRHRIELVLTMNFTDTELLNRVELIKEEWEGLDAINVGNKYFYKGKEKVKSFEKYPKELDFLEDVKDKKTS